MGVNECFGAKGIKAINIGGCPPNPLNLVGTLVAFLRGDNIELDANNRPMMFYGSSVHDQCERREHFDNGEFAPSFDSEEARNGWCLYDLPEGQIQRDQLARGRGTSVHRLQRARFLGQTVPVL